MFVLILEVEMAVTRCRSPAPVFSNYTFRVELISMFLLEFCAYIRQLRSSCDFFHTQERRVDIR